VDAPKVPDDLKRAVEEAERFAQRQAEEVAGIAEAADSPEVRQAREDLERATREYFDRVARVRRLLAQFENLQRRRTDDRL
jgi:hypothetical protein